MLKILFNWFIAAIHNQKYSISLNDNYIIKSFLVYIAFETFHRKWYSTTDLLAAIYTWMEELLEEHRLHRTRHVIHHFSLEWWSRVRWTSVLEISWECHLSFPCNPWLRSERCCNFFQLLLLDLKLGLTCNSATCVNLIRLLIISMEYEWYIVINSPFAKFS